MCAQTHEEDTVISSTGIIEIQHQTYTDTCMYTNSL